MQRDVFKFNTRLRMFLNCVNPQKTYIYYFQEEEKKRRENLNKIMEENQRKIDEQQKKMVKNTVAITSTNLSFFRRKKGLK